MKTFSTTCVFDLSSTRLTKISMSDPKNCGINKIEVYTTFDFKRVWGVNPPSSPSLNTSGFYLIYDPQGLNDGVFLKRACLVNA